MSVITGKEVRSILGPIEDSVVARIVELHPTRAEVAAAYSWLSTNDAPMNAGERLGSGKVAEIIDILETTDDNAPSGSLD